MSAIYSDLKLLFAGIGLGAWFCSWFVPQHIFACGIVAMVAAGAAVAFRLAE